MRSWILAVVLIISPAASDAAAGSSEFPFELREGLIWVQVNTLQSKGPLNFLLDTGAEVSVLNLSTARRLGLPLGPRVKVRGVHSTQIGRWPQRLTAEAGGVALPTNYLALSLSRLSRKCQRPLDGLIGADFLRNKVVQIDFTERKIRLLPADGAPDGAVDLPLDMSHRAPRVEVRVNDGPPQQMRLDTGCASDLQWVTGRRGTAKAGTELAVGLAEVSIPQTTTTVEFGPHRFEQVPTGLHRKPIFPDEDGLLGNGLLSRFHSVTIDSRSGRLILGEVHPTD